MARPCTVCKHPDRDAIEERVRLDGVKPTARDLGVSPQALYRHLAAKHRHDGADLPPPPATAPKPSPTATSPRAPGPPKKPQERRAPPPPVTLPTTGAEWKAYFAKRIRGGTLNGARVIEHLHANNPDLDVAQLVESMEQAGQEIRFMRGTELVRRLTLVARAEHVYRAALKSGDHKAALRVLEFIAKTDGLTTDLSPFAALMASEAWRTIAPGLMTNFPAAYTFAVTALVTEESKKRAALAPVIVQTEPVAAE